MTVENTQTDAAPSQDQQEDTSKKDRGDFFDPTAAAAVATDGEVIPAAEKEAAPPAKVDGEDTPDPTKAADKAAAEDPDKDGDKPRNEDGTFKPKEPLIPKSRFDKAGRKAAETIAAVSSRLAQAERELMATHAGDDAELEKLLDEKTAEYTKLLQDAEVDKANAVMKDINRINRKLAAADAVAISKKTASAGHAEMSFREAVSHYEAEYPELDQHAEGNNQDAIKWVNARVSTFIKAGMSESEALAEAVEDAIPRFSLKAASAADDKPAPKADKNAERKAAAVAKNVDAAKKQPPKTDSVGQDSDKDGASKVAVHELSLADFEKLPENVVKRARGDII